MFEDAPGTLSDSEFMKAAADEPKLASAIKKRFKKHADDLLAALRQGVPHPLHDDAWNLIVDTLLNESVVLSEFVGNGSYGAYSIQVVGIGNLCYAHAPEFDRVGVFPNIDLAEDYITENWTDTLESHEPQRTIHAFDVMMRRAISASASKSPKRQERPQPQIRMLSRGYAKLFEDSFLALQNRLLGGDEKYNTEELAKHLFQVSNSKQHIKEVRACLTKVGWADVSIAFERLIDALNKDLEERLEGFRTGKP